MTSLWSDLRYALRQLRRSPGFAAIAILTLALGVAINTAIFGIVNGFLFSSLHIPQENRVVVFGFRQKGTGWYSNLSLPEYRDLRAQTKNVFSGVVASMYSLDGLSAQGGQPDRVFDDYVTGNYFHVLGVRPFLGRFFLPSEGSVPGADPVTVLGYDYWKRQFAGDPGIVGRKVFVDGRPFTVIGVTPKNFLGFNPGGNIQIYLPLAMMVPLENLPPDQRNHRDSRGLRLHARLQPGVTREQANATLAVVARRFAVEHPRTEKDAALRSFPLYVNRGGGIDTENAAGIVSAFFLGLAGAVLLLACVNVVNLLLARASVREREMVIRSALGAKRSRLVRQVLTESILLAFLGGTAGMALGIWASSLLGSVNLHTALPFSFDFSPDWHVFAFSAAIAVFAGMVVGAFPALRFSRDNLNLILRESGRGVAPGGSKFRSALVVMQVAAALMLLVVAGLFVRSLNQAKHIQLGFNPSNVLTLTMDTGEIGYNTGQRRDFYTNLLQRVRALPGVLSATMTDVSPMNPTQTSSSTDTVIVPGYQPQSGQPAPSADFIVVATDYFRTLRIPLLQGRSFTASDNENSQRVAIVSEAMAKKFWPNQSPIGKQFTVGSDPAHPIRVVGISRDARYQSVIGAFPLIFYVPFQQHSASQSLETLAVRTTSGNPASMIPEVESTIHNMVPMLPVFGVETLQEALYGMNGLLIFQIAAALAGIMGTLGLVLAVIGVYGVLSYVVGRKTNEIGIRMAMGAKHADILRMIYRQGLQVVGIGLAVGLVASFLAAHLMRSFIVVSATDPITFVGVSAILVVIALLACYIPARRAMLIDPMQALREE